MDIQFDSEATEFADTARRYLDEAWSFTARREIIASDEGFSRKQWAGFADLGWLSLSAGEAYGGLGLGPAYLYLLMEQLGRGLVVSPYVPTVVIAGTAIELVGTEKQKQDLLPRIGAGNFIVAFANDEPGNLRNPLRIAMTARASGGGYQLRGRKSVVAFAHAADLLLVSARISGAPDDSSGIGLFLVDPKADGLSMSTFRTFDGGKASEVVLQDVVVPQDRVLGAPGDAGKLLEQLIDRGAAALAMDAVGGMRAVLDMTVNYAKSREQFGQRLGSFQALQHRMVDMFITCELAQSLAHDAAAGLTEIDSAEARRRISAAKARIGRDALAVAKEGINLHGGVGLTEEYQVGHFLKRTVVFNQMYGEPAWHLARYQSLA